MSMAPWYFVGLVAAGLAIAALWPRKVSEEKTWSDERFEDTRNDHF